MIRPIPIAAFILAVSFGAAIASPTSPDPSGVWMRGDGNARVRIAPCGENICAVNLWIKDTSKGEEVGDRLVMTVKPESSDVLEGSAFDAKRHLTYSLTITVQKASLSTRGCIIGGLICKTEAWSRAQ